MANAAAKAVAAELADLWSRTDYVVDKVSDQSALVGAGDSADIADISALTVNASGGTDMTIESVTTNVLNLAVNLQPAICASFPLTSRTQLLNGAWASQVASQAVIQLKNSIDNSLCRDYLAESLCWTTGTAATYHVNVAADSLVEDDFSNAIAMQLSTDGTQMQNLAFFLSPYAAGSLKSIAGYNQQVVSQNGQLGIPQIGSVDGVPVYLTNAIRRNKVIATTAGTISSNQGTFTCGAGHGVVAGQRVTFAGMTGAASNTAAVTVVSTTATTIVAPYTESDGALADGVGTITTASSDNLLLDLSGIYVARQVFPMVRIVPNTVQTSDILQIGALWGRIGRAGKAVVMHSPGSSA